MVLRYLNLKSMTVIGRFGGGMLRLDWCNVDINLIKAACLQVVKPLDLLFENQARVLNRSISTRACRQPV